MNGFQLLTACDAGPPCISITAPLFLLRGLYRTAGTRLPSISFLYSTSSPSTNASSFSSFGREFVICLKLPLLYSHKSGGFLGPEKRKYNSSDEPENFGEEMTPLPKFIDFLSSFFKSCICKIISAPAFFR